MMSASAFDEQVTPVGLKVDRESVLSELKKQNLKIKDFCHVKERYFFYYFLSLYGVVALIFLTYYHVPAPLRYVPWVVIPFLQHALFNIVHEAAHGLLSTSSLRNEIYGNIMALPVGMTAQSYRDPHRGHHLFETIPHYQLRRLHKILVTKKVQGALPVKGGFYRTVLRIFKEA